MKPCSHVICKTCHDTLVKPSKQCVVCDVKIDEKDAVELKREGTRLFRRPFQHSNVVIRYWIRRWRPRGSEESRRCIPRMTCIWRTPQCGSARPIFTPLASSCYIRANGDVLLLTTVAWLVICIPDLDCFLVFRNLGKILA